MASAGGYPQVIRKGRWNHIEVGKMVATELVHMVRKRKDSKLPPDLGVPHEPET